MRIGESLRDEQPGQSKLPKRVVHSVRDGGPLGAAEIQLPASDRAHHLVHDGILIPRPIELPQHESVEGGEIDGGV